MFQALFGFFARQRTIESVEMNDHTTNWLSEKLKWCPTSLASLKEAEKKILSYVKNAFFVRDVNILSSEGGDTWRIRTLIMNEEDEVAWTRTPLVLLHGMGAAIGLWVLNLDALSNRRPLYAIDVLGFGLSSRPSFNKNPFEVEEQYVKSIELWREQMGLKKFILLGHSMGGYLATAYAMKYPENVCHLILAEPWGFAEYKKTVQKIQIPFWAKLIANVLQYFNPLTGLRVAGPWGPKLIERMRPDVLQKFTSVLKDPDDVANYIYHCNAQTPSGESAFKILSKGIGWAKNPMIPRITDLKEDIPITFLYGSRSWMDSQSGETVKQIRSRSKVDVILINGAGHHVNADQANVFNSCVQEICEEVDETQISDSCQSFEVIQKRKCNIENDSDTNNVLGVSSGS